MRQRQRQLQTSDPDELKRMMHPRKRGSKYHNKRCTLDSLTFDSLSECGRWVQLLDMFHRGEINHLRPHVPFELAAGIVYEADFTYTRGGVWVAEDVKGAKTAAFRLKAKLFQHHFHHPIELVKPTAALVALARAAGAKELP